MRYWYVTDLEIQRDIVFTFGFPDAKGLCYMLEDRWLGPTDHSAIQLNDEISTAVNFGAEWLSHA